MIPHLMSLLSRSHRTQEYITQIFSHCCKVFVGALYTYGGESHHCEQMSVSLLIHLCLQTPEHQTVLFNHGAIQNIAPLLISPSFKVKDRLIC